MKKPFGNIKVVIGAIVSLLFLAWILYGFFAPFFTDGKSPDCASTDRGCQGDTTRWGQ